MKKPSVLAVFFAVFTIFPQIAAAQNWVLSAVPFEYRSTSKTSGDSVRAAAEELPKLVLAELQGRGSRILEESEIEQKVLYDLRQERQELFVQLSGKIAEKDELFFAAGSAYGKKKLEKQKDSEIAQIQKQIEENLKKAANPLGAFAAENTKSSRKNQKIEYLSELRPGDSAQLAIYKDSAEELFTPRCDDETLDDFENRAVENKIDGIITGSIIERAGFLQATVNLVLYPGAKIECTLNDIGSMKDLGALAATLAKSLYPYVINSKPVKLRFEIFPAEAAKIARIYVDGATPQNSGEIDVQNGKHQVYIYAEGFESKSFSYSFTQTDEFVIQVKMPKKEIVRIALASANRDGDFYANAMPVQDKNDLSLDKGHTLGEFAGENGKSQFFMLDNQPGNKSGAEQSGKLNFKPITFNDSLLDFPAQIEKSRSDLYNSYAGLLISLPFTFFSKGMSIAMHNSYLYDRADPADVTHWKLYNYAFTTVSAVMGINFLYNVGRYLYMGNSLMPQTLKIAPQNQKYGDFMPANDSKIEENTTNSIDSNIEEN